jgi:hypothetical protein
VGDNKGAKCVTKDICNKSFYVSDDLTCKNSIGKDPNGQIQLASSGSLWFGPEDIREGIGLWSKSDSMYRNNPFYHKPFVVNKGKYKNKLSLQTANLRKNFLRSEFGPRYRRFEK